MGDRFPGGESYEQMAAGTWTFLRDALRRDAAPPILIIGHRAI